MVTTAKLRARAAGRAKPKSTPFKNRSRKLGKGPQKRSSDTNHLADTKVKRIKLTKQTLFEDRAENVDLLGQEDAQVTTSKGRTLQEVGYMARHSQPARRVVAVECIADIFERYGDREPQKLKTVFERLLTISLDLLMDESSTVRSEVENRVIEPLFKCHSNGIVSLAPFLTLLKSTLKSLISDPMKSNVRILRLCLTHCPEIFDANDTHDLILRLIAKQDNEDQAEAEDQDSSDQKASRVLPGLTETWISPLLAIGLIYLENNATFRMTSAARNHVEKSWLSLRSQIFFEVLDTISSRFDSSPFAYLQWIQFLVDLSHPGLVEPSEHEVPRLEGEGMTLNEYIDEQEIKLLHARGDVAREQLKATPLVKRISGAGGYGLCRLYPNSTSAHPLPASRSVVDFWRGCDPEDRRLSGLNSTSLSSGSGYSEIYLKNAMRVFKDCLRIGTTLWLHCQTAIAGDSSSPMHILGQSTAIQFLREVLTALAICSSHKRRYAVNHCLKYDGEAPDDEVWVRLSSHILSEVETYEILKGGKEETQIKSLFQKVSTIGKAKAATLETNKKSVANRPMNRFAGLLDDSDDSSS